MYLVLFSILSLHKSIDAHPVWPINIKIYEICLDNDNDDNEMDYNDDGNDDR